jgi:phospholipid-binding lipoprotein MlaA
MQLVTTSKTIFGLVFLLGILSGCATTPDNPDPYEKFNRHVFTFNQDIDKALLKPVAETYKAVVPESIDQGVTNVFSNLNDITVVANELLQFKFKHALADAGRLLINSTVGIIGFFDVAGQNGLPKHYEDFGQTLGYWGINSGPYLMLPFFGPSTMRDAWAMGADIFLDPRTYYATSEGSNVRNFLLTTNITRYVDMRADLLGYQEIVDTAATDNYAYIRDAFLQRRQYLIYDGNPPKKSGTFDENDLFEDLDKKDSTSDKPSPPTPGDAQPSGSEERNSNLPK